MQNIFKYGFRCEGFRGDRLPCRVRDLFAHSLEAPESITAKTDFYLSAYTFGEDFVEYLKTTGSTAKFDGYCFTDWVWLDVDFRKDRGECLNDSLVAARKLVEFIVGGFLVPNAESVFIAFTGAKGFCVGIPISVFGSEAQASVVFHQKCKVVAEKIANTVGAEIDPVVYDKVRLWRCPNTRNSKTGLFKIQLSHSELTELSLDEILEMAKTPRQGWIPTASAMPEAERFWKEAVDVWGMMDSLVSELQERVNREGVKSQTQQLPGSGEIVPRLRRDTLEYLQHGAERGERNSRLFQAVCDCKACGWPAEAVWSAMVDVARGTGLPIREIEETIRKGMAR